MIVLGVDSGTKHCAFAVVNVAPRRPMWMVFGVYEPDVAWEVFGNLLRDDRPNLVAIECAEALHDGNLGNKAVLGTVRLAGEFRGCARSRGFDTIYLTAARARMALIGRSPKGSNQDAALKRVLLATVDDMPERTNCHERDACAAALVGARMWKRRVAA